MSLPITAVGPLNVLIKPILTVFCWAIAGPAASASAAAARTVVLFMVCILPIAAPGGAEALRCYLEASLGSPNGRFDRARGR